MTTKQRDAFWCLGDGLPGKPAGAWVGPFTEDEILGAAKNALTKKRYAVDLARFRQWDQSGEFKFAHGLTIRSHA